MKSVKSETTPNWKKMAQQLQLTCEEAHLITLGGVQVGQDPEQCSLFCRTVDEVYDVTIDKRNKEFKQLVMELTDLDEKGADELIEKGTELIGYSLLVNRLALCCEPPIVEYGFGWWFNFVFDDSIGWCPK